MTHEFDPGAKLQPFIDLAGRRPGDTAGLIEIIDNLPADELQRLAATELEPKDYADFAAQSTAAHTAVGIDLPIDSAEAKGFLESIIDRASGKVKK